MLYTINNKTYKKHRVKLYKFNVSTKRIHLANQSRRQMNERCVCSVLMLPDESFIQIENVKQEAQIYYQTDFNHASKIKNAYLDSTGKMTLYIIYLGWLNPYFEHVNGRWNILFPYSKFIYAFQSRIQGPCQV